MAIQRTSDVKMKEQQAFMAKVANMEHGQKRCLLHTLGCQQNESDSEKLAGMLREMGYRMTDRASEADVILYNTCAVRENAERKLFGHIGALKKLKEAHPALVIGVCGCMAQEEGIEATFRKSYPYVDMVFGTHSLYRFPELLYKALSDRLQIYDIQQIDGEITEGIPVARDGAVKAYLSVMYGCNNFCSYCIVPYVRGRERSRDWQDVLDEAKSIADAGYKEVMLLGQNVNSYKGGVSFAELLARVSEVDGIERIRFMSSHPKDISRELIDVMAEKSNICKQLHLPVQSGSDRILRLMNRRYDVAHYLDSIDYVRKKMPSVTLTTDIIVGFPGETHEDFRETMALLERVRYDSLYSFLYSRRKGTAAYAMPDVMSEEEKHRNFEEMLNVQNRISLEKNKALIGSVQRVLVEGASKTDLGKQSGRSDGGKLVHFAYKGDLTGCFVDVKIDEVNTWNLMGEKLSERV